MRAQYGSTLLVFILSLSLFFMGCSSGQNFGAGGGSGSSVDETFQSAASTNLAAELKTAGYTDAQILILKNAGENSAASLSSIVIKKVSVLSGSTEAIADGKNFLEGVQKELDNTDAGFNDANKVEILGLLIKSLVLTYKDKTPEIGSGEEMNDLMEELVSTAVENLGDIGLSATTEVVKAAQSIVSSSIANLDELAPPVNIKTLIAKVVTTAMSSISNTTGIQASDYSILAKGISLGASSAITDSGISGVTDIGAAVQEINVSMLGAINSLGVTATDTAFQSLVSALAEGTIAGINSLGVTTAADAQAISQSAALGILLGCNQVSGYDASKLPAIESAIQTGAASGIAQLTNLDASEKNNLSTGLESYIDDADYASDPSYEAPPAPTTANASSIASIELLLSAPDADDNEIWDYGDSLIDVPVGHCTTVKVTVKDASSNALIMNQNTTITLADVNAQSTFYSHSNCSASTSTVVIGTGFSHATAYVKTTHPGTQSLTATYNSIVGAVDYPLHSGLPYSMDAIIYPDQFADIDCPTAGENQVRFRLLDVYGNATYARANTNLTVMAGTPGSTGVIDPLNSCQADSTFQIATYGTHVDIGFIADNAGTFSFTVTHNLNTSTPTVSTSLTFILPEIAYVNSQEGTQNVAVNDCVSLTAAAVDYQFSQRNPTSNILVTLNATGVAGGEFYSDAACTAQITTVTIMTSETNKAIYFKPTNTGDYTIQYDVASPMIGLGTHVIAN